MNIPPALPVDTALPSPQLTVIEDPKVELSVRVTVRLFIVTEALSVGGMLTVIALVADSGRDPVLYVSVTVKTTE